MVNEFGLNSEEGNEYLKVKFFFDFQPRTDEKEVCNVYCSRKISFVPNIIKHNLWVSSFLGDELNVSIEFFW